MSDKKRGEHTQTIQVKISEVCEEEKEPCLAFLTVIRAGGADLGRTIQIGEIASIGRDPDCELCIKDMGVSWHHARIKAGDSDRYLVEDSGSTNGTRVDGQIILGPWALQNGQKIFLGETVVRFSLADELEAGFQREVAQLVGTDPLTGLESKRSFDDALDHALSSANPTGGRVGVLMMDMDGIKQINDTHGHLFGAHCIRTAGQIIGQQVGRGGHTCRWGGDEFSVFLPGADRGATMQTAERIRAAIDEAGMEKDGIELHPTISVGVAVFPDDAEKVLDLVAQADQALYRAKAQGKNRVSD
jgi:two-component system cell cycle response regulator